MGKNNGLLKNISWSFIEKLLSQGVTVIISIILARLLSPDDYGVLAIVNVFIALVNVFVTSGMGVALVQDQDIDEVTICTDFYLGFLVGVLLYIVLYFSAPIIAEYYVLPQLTNVVRVLGIRIPFSSIYSIQRATMTRKMEFQKLVLPTTLSTLISGILGVVTAYLGWGVWALVVQSLSGQIVIVAIFAFVVQWKPSFTFSVKKAKQHFSYSIHVISATLINTFVAQLQTLVIGKAYTGADVAYYNNGVNYPQRIVEIIESSVNAVTFPAIANQKDNQENVRNIMKMTIRHVSFILTPMMLGLALCAEHAVNLLLTEKWLPSVPYMQIACLIFVFMPLNGTNYEATKAIGKGKLFLRIQVIKTIINIASLFLALPYGMLAIAWSGFFAVLATIVLNAYPAGKFYGYGIWPQLKDLMPACVYCVPMTVVLLLMNYYLNYSSFTMLFLEVTTGVILYFVTAFLLKSDSLYFVLEKFSKSYKRSDSK